MSPKIIALSGAHGLIGSALKKTLEANNYQVWPLVRSKGQLGPGSIAYDYKSGFIEAEKLADCHAVIHLAGKNLFSGLWTARFKQELYESRVMSTELIARTMRDGGPKILLNASAIGIYGDGGSQVLNESSPKGAGFLADLCKAWEDATDIAKKAHVRVVNLRFGIVISDAGGMYKKLEPLFKAGLGGVLGDGNQYLSLVALKDVVDAIMFALEQEAIKGPINVVAPEAITNKAFTEQLGQKFNRPTWLHAPAWLLKVLGEQSHMVLASAQVYPSVLLNKGFRFSCLNFCEMVKSL